RGGETVDDRGAVLAEHGRDLVGAGGCGQMSDAHRLLSCSITRPWRASRAAAATQPNHRHLVTPQTTAAAGAISGSAWCRLRLPSSRCGSIEEAHCAQRANGD